MCVLAGLTNGRACLFFGSRQITAPSDESHLVGSLLWTRQELNLSLEALPLPPTVSCALSTQRCEVWCSCGPELAVLRLDAEAQKSSEDFESVDFAGCDLEAQHRFAALAKIGDFVWAILKHKVALLKFSISSRSLVGCIDLLAAPTSSHGRFRALSIQSRIAASTLSASAKFQHSSSHAAETLRLMSVGSSRTLVQQVSPLPRKKTSTHEMSEVAAGEIEGPDQAATCLLAAGTTLWIGQNNGNILIIEANATSTSERSCGVGRFGEGCRSSASLQ